MKNITCLYIIPDSSHCIFSISQTQTFHQDDQGQRVQTNMKIFLDTMWTSARCIVIHFSDDSQELRDNHCLCHTDLPELQPSVYASPEISQTYVSTICNFQYM